MRVLFKTSWAAAALSTSLLLVGSQSAAAELDGQAFHSPSEAARALARAAKADDVDALLKILGPSAKDLLVTSDTVADKNARETFATRASAKMTVVTDPARATQKIVEVGNDLWPLPIPLVQKDGKWYFDVDQGRNTIRLRRIGDDELTAINVCRGYVEAQYDYASREHHYAEKFISTRGKRDGLYWESTDPNDQSPIAATVANAIAEGYTDKDQPFHGYRFKILTSGKPGAGQGEVNFIENGTMARGFALIAWPADYGTTGVMTFMVNRTGIVYQKDLGDATDMVAGGTTSYDPDQTWTPVGLPTEAP